MDESLNVVTPQKNVGQVWLLRTRCLNKVSVGGGKLSLGANFIFAETDTLWPPDIPVHNSAGLRRVSFTTRLMPSDSIQFLCRSRDTLCKNPEKKESKMTVQSLKLNWNIHVALGTGLVWFPPHLTLFDVPHSIGLRKLKTCVTNDRRRWSWSWHADKESNPDIIFLVTIFIS